MKGIFSDELEEFQADIKEGIAAAGTDPRY